MDNFTKASLIWLSLQLSLLGYATTRLAYDLGYANGKAYYMQQFAPDETDYRPYEKEGSNRAPKPKTNRGH